MQSMKRAIWGAFRRAGYTILHNHEYLALEARPDLEMAALLAEKNRPVEEAAKTEAEEVLPQVEIRPDYVRPLKRVTVHSFQTAPQKITAQSVAAIRGLPAYADVAAYFAVYPPRSLMSDHSRATLYTLVRTMRPAFVAEIGTLFAGTTEVIARALWENNHGAVYSTDPFGAERCPAIIEAWPEPLRNRTVYHPQSSMDFFAHMEHCRIAFDLVLVDGNHDYEFALFDLLEAAKLLRPGGIIVMDNAEQTGPYQAARTFLASHPDWQELGSAIAAFDAAKPFDETRASVPDTSFILLKAPDYFAVHATPKSWGQSRLKSNIVDGIVLDAVAQKTSGLLHYHAIFRAFGDASRDVVELKSVGSWPIDLNGEAMQISHAFEAPLVSDMQSRHPDVRFTLEIELAWQAHLGAPSLALRSVPSPMATQ